VLIVSDASPVIALAVCNKLELLDELFDRVCVPQAVFNELAVSDKPKARDIIKWATPEVVSVKTPSATTALAMNLDIGESEALALYWEAKADFLLIDEKRGRLIALRNGIRTIGTIGILLASRQRGLIETIKPLLDTLMRNGFRISDSLYHQVLERAGEE
jgi:predicted nucleic acid-binding protein